MLKDKEGDHYQQRKEKLFLKLPTLKDKGGDHYQQRKEKLFLKLPMLKDKEEGQPQVHHLEVNFIFNLFLVVGLRPTNERASTRTRTQANPRSSIGDYTSTDRTRASEVVVPPVVAPVRKSSRAKKQANPRSSIGDYKGPSK
jgi:hypothetical protein